MHIERDTDIIFQCRNSTIVTVKMETMHRQALLANRVKLIMGLRVDNELLSYMMTDKILLDNHVEDIMLHQKKRERAATLLRILPTRGPKAWERFMET